MRLATTIVLLASAVFLAACGKKKDEGPIAPASPSKGDGKAGSGTKSTGSPASDAVNPAGLDASKDLSADLKKLMEGTNSLYGTDNARLQALIKTFVLPNYEAWMKQTFGDEFGGERAKRYAELLLKFEKMVMEFFESTRAVRQTEVSVVRLTDPADRNAKPAQAAALRAMKQPVALYTVHFIEKDEDAGKNMWSWVYVDGAFRLIGK